MKSIASAERIRLKLRLAKTTDRHLEVFGARSHQYFLGKPLSMEAVEQFEKKYNVSLPEDYKWFLTQVGNGGIEYKESVVGNSGAGPLYGLFYLDHPHQFLEDPSTGFLTKETLYDESWHHDDWFQRFYTDVDDSSDKAYEEECAKALSGILAIAYGGCSHFAGIVLNGKDRGRILNVYEEIEYCPHFYKEHTFLEWYENWLDGVISGELIFESGNVSLSEESCIQRFQSDSSSHQQLVSLSYLRFFSSLSKQSIAILWEHYEKEEDSFVLLELINLLIKFDYSNAKEEFEGFLEVPILFLITLHLYAKQHTKEWKRQIQQIKKEHPENVEIQEYIQYITEKDMRS